VVAARSQRIYGYVMVVVVLSQLALLRWTFCMMMMV